jgi:hypothetical protein
MAETQQTSVANALTVKKTTPMALKSQRPVIQKYTEQGAYKVSDGGGLAIAKDTDRPHEYFSTDPLFEASAGKLTELDAPVLLIKGAANEALGDIAALYYVTAGKKDTPTARHPLEKSECIEVAAEILKAPDTGKWMAKIAGMNVALNPFQIDSIQKLIHPIVTAPTGTVRSPAQFGRYIAQANEPKEKTTVMPRSGVTFFATLKALDKEKYPSVLKKAILANFENSEMPIHKLAFFMDYLTEAGEKGEYASLKDEDEDGPEEIISGLMRRVEQDYSKLFAHDSKHPATATGYGINEKAVAELGEALAIRSTGPREKDSAKWNFHLASVIAKEGGDVVTMENETNSKEDRIGNWAFKMYGSKKGQSFHETHAHGAENPLTVAVTPKRED